MVNNLFKRAKTFIGLEEEAEEQERGYGDRKCGLSPVNVAARRHTLSTECKRSRHSVSDIIPSLRRKGI